MQICMSIIYPPSSRHHGICAQGKDHSILPMHKNTNKHVALCNYAYLQMDNPHLCLSQRIIYMTKLILKLSMGYAHLHVNRLPHVSHSSWCLCTRHAGMDHSMLSMHKSNDTHVPLCNYAYLQTDDSHQYPPNKSMWLFTLQSSPPSVPLSICAQTSNNPGMLT